MAKPRSPELVKVQAEQLYALLHVAEEDLHQASFFADHLLKKGWHFEPWEKRWTLYMQQAAFTTALATAYSRPFTESRGWPKFPTRLLAGLSAEQRQLHKRVLELRNRVYAHSDLASRSIRPFVFEGHPAVIEMLPPMRFTSEELRRIQTIIKLAQRAIAARKSDLARTVAS
jgi:hypothetical protein